MTIMLPQDPRSLQQQQFAQLAVQGLLGIFERQEAAKLQKQQAEDQEKLMRQLGLLDPDPRAKQQLFNALDIEQPTAGGDANDGILPGGDVVSAQPDPEQPRQPQLPPSPPAPPSRLAKLTDQHLLSMEVSDNKLLQTLAKAEKSRRGFDIKERELTQKGFIAERKAEEARSNPFLLDIDKKRSATRQKTEAVNLMRDAIERGDVGFFSKDNFAKFLGRFGGALRTAKGQQLINAQKEFLLSNIQRAGSRPNQWIEQQIANMLPQIGISDEANLTVSEILEHEAAAEKLEQDVADELSAQDKQEFGFVKGDIAARVSKEVDEKAKALQDRLAYRLRLLHEQELGSDELQDQAKRKVPSGTFLTPQMASIIRQSKGVDGDMEKMIKRARQLGYAIPSPDQIREWSSAR